MKTFIEEVTTNTMQKESASPMVEYTKRTRRKTVAYKMKMKGKLVIEHDDLEEDNMIDEKNQQKQEKTMNNQNIEEKQSIRGVEIMNNIMLHR